MSNFVVRHVQPADYRAAGYLVAQVYFEDEHESQRHDTREQPDFREGARGHEEDGEREAVERVVARRPRVGRGGERSARGAWGVGVGDSCRERRGHQCQPIVCADAPSISGEPRRGPGNELAVDGEVDALLVEGDQPGDLLALG